jgi:hypothetical protein
MPPLLFGGKMELLEQYRFALTVFGVLFLYVMINRFSFWRMVVQLLHISIGSMALFLEFLSPCNRLSGNLYHIISVTGNGHFTSSARNPWDMKPKDMKKSIVLNRAYVIKDDTEGMKIRTCNPNGLDTLIEIKWMNNDFKHAAVRINLAKSPEGKTTFEDGFDIGLYEGSVGLNQVINNETYTIIKEKLMSSVLDDSNVRGLTVMNRVTGDVLSVTFTDDITEEEINKKLEEIREFTKGSEELTEEGLEKLGNIMRCGEKMPDGITTFTLDDIPDHFATTAQVDVKRVSVKDKVKELKSETGNDSEEMLKRFKEQRKINFGKIQDLSNRKGGDDV